MYCPGVHVAILYKTVEDKFLLQFKFIASLFAPPSEKHPRARRNRRVTIEHIRRLSCQCFSVVGRGKYVKSRGIAVHTRLYSAVQYFPLSAGRPFRLSYCTVAALAIL